jgi:NTE family protein
VARNIPVDVVRNMGADVLIAVDVGTPLSVVTTNTSVLGIADQILGILTVNNTKEQLALLTERDVLVSPPLGKEVATADFTKGKEALAIGVKGVEAVEGRLAALGVSEAAYAQNRAIRTGRQTTVPTIQFVRLDNRSPYSDELIMARIQDPVGKPLDSEKLEKDLYRLFGYNTLQLSTYEVVHEDGKTGVVLHVREKVQGPNYLEFGLSAASDFEGRFDFNLRVGVLQSPINESGGELRYLLQIGDETQLFGEYYQPFGALGRWFFATRLQYDDLKINQFDSDGNKLNEYNARQIGGVALFGREFGNYGALNVGYRRFTGEAEVNVGDPALPDFDFDTGQVFLEGTLDRHDNFYFPRDGYLARTRYTFSRESFGADADFEQFDVDAIGAKSFGKHAIQIGGRYHATTSGVASIQNIYRLGGYSRLAGFKPNELTGQDYFVALGGYLYEFGKLAGQPAYLGGSIEYGNAFQRRSDMEFGDGLWNGSVWLGVDSWIGPMQLGIGAREGGEQNLYLTIGQRF